MLGAGDGFMSGLLKGWLTDQDWPTALKYANACGAFAVSRHGCTPAYPSWEELQFFLDRGIKVKALRKDAELEQIHWSTNRLRRLAGDAGLRLRPPHAARSGRRRARASTATASAPSSSSASRPRSQVAAGRPGYGILCDGRLGRDALYAAAGTGLWIGRPVEYPGSRPLRLEAEIEPDYGTRARRMAARARGQGARLLPPRRHARDEGRPGGDRRAPRPRRPRQPASSSCSRSSRPRSRRSPTPPRPRSSSASTTSGSIPTGGSSSR